MRPLPKRFLRSQFYGFRSSFNLRGFGYTRRCRYPWVIKTPLSTKTTHMALHQKLSCVWCSAARIPTPAWQQDTMARCSSGQASADCSHGAHRSHASMGCRAKQSGQACAAVPKLPSIYKGSGEHLWTGLFIKGKVGCFHCHPWFMNSSRLARSPVGSESFPNMPLEYALLS